MYISLTHCQDPFALASSAYHMAFSPDSQAAQVVLPVKFSASQSTGMSAVFTMGHVSSSFQFQIVYLNSETPFLHWKFKLRNVWRQQNSKNAFLHCGHVCRASKMAGMTCLTMPSRLMKEGLHTFTWRPFKGSGAPQSIPRR